MKGASCSNRPISDCCVGSFHARNVFNGFTHVRPCADQLRPPCASIVPFVQPEDELGFVKLIGIVLLYRLLMSLLTTTW